MKQGIRVPRKQMVRGRDGENHRNTAENSCEAEGKCPIIEGKKNPLPLTLCRLVQIPTYACRFAEIFTSKRHLRFLVVWCVPVLSPKHVMVAVLQTLQQHL